jgi:DNA repair protein RecO (recombination protein O)
MAMIETATGLILRTRPLTETSLIVHWLTPDHGRLATVAKGACRPKSPFRGKLDLFYLADFSFSRSQRSELHNLREVSLRKIHTPLRRELILLQQAAYCAELIEQTTETETPLPVFFELLDGLLDALPHQPPGPQAILGFELKLLNELGLEPDLAGSGLAPGTAQIARALAEGDWDHISRLRLSAAQTVELRQFLHRFILSHLGKIPRARAAAVGTNPD